jgi:uncharacterized repeat protein (TIGR04076 family)
VGNPGRLVIEKTDSICLATFSAIFPLSSALTRVVMESWGYMDRIRYFSCLDCERLVIFKVERIKVEHEEYPTLYNG